MPSDSDRSRRVSKLNVKYFNDEFKTSSRLHGKANKLRTNQETQMKADKGSTQLSFELFSLGLQPWLWL